MTLAVSESFSTPIKKREKIGVFLYYVKIPGNRNKETRAQQNVAETFFEKIREIVALKTRAKTKSSS